MLPQVTLLDCYSRLLDSRLLEYNATVRVKVTDDNARVDANGGQFDGASQSNGGQREDG